MPPTGRPGRSSSTPRTRCSPTPGADRSAPVTASASSTGRWACCGAATETDSLSLRLQPAGLQSEPDVAADRSVWVVQSEGLPGRCEMGVLVAHVVVAVVPGGAAFVSTACDAVARLRTR